MEFRVFKGLMQKHFSTMLKNQTTLFVTDVDKDKLWEIYLESFPPGTNLMFRQRREYDCGCCRHFIKSFGNVVSIVNNKVITIWDFETNDATFQPVIDALAAFVRSAPVHDVFVTKESGFGTDRNYEEGESIITWDHFHIDLPTEFVLRSRESVPSVMGELRDIRNVFKRSLDEITKDSLETVLDLISQNSLYKGEEWREVLKKFLRLSNEYHRLSEEEKDLYCWTKSIEVGGAIGKIRNHSIGTLLADIADGTDLDVAVRKYEKMVAPTNYKRPKAIFTQRMIEQAQQTLADLGLLDSLSRRFATVEDINVNNIMYANRDTMRQMTGDVFDSLKREAAGVTKQFDRVEEIPIETFIRDILPRTTSIEAFIENRHSPNLVSLIAPAVSGCKSLLKWGNNFSWVYKDNLTDSMKERVKAAGGNVEGVLRFSIQWNEDGDCPNDFDAHCVEPNGNEIYYANKSGHSSSGRLDVDIIHPHKDQVAVENITWLNLEKMREGIYTFFVHTYSYRSGRSGFRAEIEFNGQTYSYEHNKDSRQDAKVIVAKVKFSRKDGFSIIESLNGTTSSKKIWNLDTNQFHPVSVVMLSPNYWDGQIGIGNKHFFFLINGCINDTNPNGFFNEYINEDLMPHKRVFEALGAKMKVEDSDSQLSGLGFSSTQRNALICKLSGHVTRTVKIVF